MLSKGDDGMPRPILFDNVHSKVDYGIATAGVI